MQSRDVEVLIESYSGYGLKVKVGENGHVTLDIDGSDSSVDVLELQEALNYVTGGYVSSRSESRSESE